MLLYKYNYSLKIANLSETIKRNGYFSSEAMFYSILDELNISKGWRVFVSDNDLKANANPEVIMYDENYFTDNRCMVCESVVGGQREFYIDGGSQFPDFL